jgi:hypothetical protein
LARAKNTERSAARRRHREQVRVAAAEVVPSAERTATEAAQAPPGPGAGDAIRSMFRLPDVRADLAMLPGMLLRTKKLWIPFAMLLASFVLAVLYAEGLIPDAVEGIVGLYVELTLPPTALFVFFIGGFLAPRASYLVGGALGLVDGILWSLLFLISPNAQPNDAARVVGPSDYLAVLVIATVVGVLAAGFAAWYRNFLRQSQERARANRIAREQQAREKAKEQARKDRDEQRRTAAAAARAARPATASAAPAQASSARGSPTAPGGKGTPA